MADKSDEGVMLATIETSIDELRSIWGRLEKIQRTNALEGQSDIGDLVGEIRAVHGSLTTFKGMFKGYISKVVGDQEKMEKLIERLEKVK